MEMENDLDLETRELCPDGACTGVVGEDHRCRVCGRARGAELGEPPTAVAGSDDPDDSDDEAADAFAGDFSEERRLCPDGACIGLVGEDGRCRVCRRSASS